MNIQFKTPHQYVFIHENVKHLLLIWSKEAKKQLFIVEEKEGELHLLYPGETYEELVLDQVEDIFFPRLETESETIQAVLGATFYYEGKLIAMYYDRERPGEQFYFFEIDQKKILEIPDEQYEATVLAFLKEFPEYVQSK